MVKRWKKSFMIATFFSTFAINFDCSAEVIGWIHEEIINLSSPYSNVLSAPATFGGSAAYITDDGVFDGVYVKQLQKEAENITATNVEVPGYGSLPFSIQSFSFSTPPPVFDKATGGVSFKASISLAPFDFFTTNDGIFSQLNGPGTLSAMAIAGVTTVSGTGNTLLTVGAPSTASGTTVFSGSDSFGDGIFKVSIPNGPVDKFIAVGDAAPTKFPRGSGVFTGFGAFPNADVNDAGISHTDTAFLGFTNYLLAGPSSGLFVSRDFQMPEVFIETGVLLPNQLSERYGNFNNSPSIDNGVLTFYGFGTQGTSGIYSVSQNSLPKTIADNHTLIPGTANIFSDFGKYASISNGAVTFEGFDANNNPGIYTNYGGKLTTVFDSNDFLSRYPNETLAGIDFFNQGFSGNQIAYHVISTDANDPTILNNRILLSVALIPEPPTLLLIFAGMVISLLFNFSQWRRHVFAFRRTMI